nr:hypothetical protein [uncultured Desulfobacter sp.]
MSMPPVTFQPADEYASILVSSPSLSTNTNYRVYTGGSSTGTVQNGLYIDGNYTSGTLETTFQLNSTVETVNY